MYMTPHFQKRKDGLCPSFLDFSKNLANGAKYNPGGMNKPYRTNSNLLLQIQDKDGKTKIEREVPILVESIKEAIDEVISAEEQEIVSSNFIPQGCEFQLELNPKLNDADKNYRIEVILFANEVNGIMNYVIDTLLITKGEPDPNPLAAPLKGYREAKQTFELVSLKVRKAVVRHEFPEFPEGCKGRAFREVYQLNARVSDCLLKKRINLIFDGISAFSAGELFRINGIPWLIVFALGFPCFPFLKIFFSQLKSGSFATVCRGTHRSTGRKVAIKCVLRKDLPPADDAAIYDEVAILSSLNHPHIVPLIDFFDEKDCYFIVMELMSGGDLFDRIGKKKTYSEADARDLVVKMLKAVAYCHTRKIAHCDMKPKNLLLMSDDNDSYIKLADFGFAARVHEPCSLTKQCGTPFFVSPEILMRKGYDQQSDMWSVGCIVYLLLSGNLPFMGRSQKELFRKIVAGKYDFDDEEWGNVSEQAKDLVSKLLVLDPNKRITAAEAVRHEWLKASKDRLSNIMLQGTSQRLKTFNARMKLRSAMIAIDWVSSLRRMTSYSQRNLNGGVPGPAGVPSAAPGEIPKMSGHGPGQTPPTNQLIAAARKMKAAEAEARAAAAAGVGSSSKSDDEGSSTGKKKSGSPSKVDAKRLSGTTKSLKKMSLKDNKKKDPKGLEV